MSTVGNWRQPDIARNGLVMYLDASSPNDFFSSRSATTWRDISGNGFNATLTNGPTFNSANGGSIVFDGSNDYAVTSTRVNVSNRFTVNAWIKLNYTTPQPTNFANRVILISNCYTYAAGKGFLISASGNNGSDFWISLGSDQKYAVSTTGYIYANTFFMMTAVVNAGDSNIKLYYNGNEVSYSTRTDGNISLAYDVSNTQIGYRSNADIMNGNMYMMQIYNRALSDVEVLQNFNATRARFGI
jgi:hypothetical protein